jgi:hypothetical protein
MIEERLEASKKEFIEEATVIKELIKSTINTSRINYQKATCEQDDGQDNFNNINNIRTTAAAATETSSIQNRNHYSI